MIYYTIICCLYTLEKRMYLRFATIESRSSDREKQRYRNLPNSRVQVSFEKLIKLSSLKIIYHLKHSL